MTLTRYDATAEENAYYRAIPETPFETALLRGVIEAAALEMGTPVTGYTVSLDAAEPGWWILYATRRPANISEILNTPTCTGRVAVVERRYPANEFARVIVMWEIAGQSNYCPFRPILDWETAE